MDVAADGDRSLYRLDIGLYAEPKSATAALKDMRHLGVTVFRKG